MIYIQCPLLEKIHFNLALNQYQDVLQLCVGTLAAIYVWCFIAKSISCTFVGKVLEYIGKDSLYVMALHIVGFFICNAVCIKLGLVTPQTSHGLYTFEINSYLILLMYLLFGACFPLLVIYLFRKFKELFKTTSSL